MATIAGHGRQEEGTAYVVTVHFTGRSGMGTARLRWGSIDTLLQ